MTMSEGSECAGPTSEMANNGTRVLSESGEKHDHIQDTSAAAPESGAFEVQVVSALRRIEARLDSFAITPATSSHASLPVNKGTTDRSLSTLLAEALATSETRMAELSRTKDDLNHIFAALGWANISTSDAVAIIASLRADLAEHRIAITSLKQSKSWRLTAPLRALTNLVGGASRTRARSGQ